MLIFNKKSQLEAHLLELKGQNITLGFVPTMGALHNGHLSLIAAAKKQCHVTICSVFVNPTQFNDAKDLENYPRMPEKDLKMLEFGQCDIVFMPSVEEMYQKNEKMSVFDFANLDKILEGEHRPGHFNGVAQIVKRLFEIIKPNKAFFGSKDYQQVLVVKKLAEMMGNGIEIVPCPIIREPDGLAMSSRNALLSETERKSASQIPLIMREAKDIVVKHSISAARVYINAEVRKIPFARLDYYEVCEADTLKILSHFDSKTYCISLIAVYIGNIRLIDNLILN
jgi:pantoate--beta-alanine ligase